MCELDREVIDWDKFEVFFRIGIPSAVLYASFVVCMLAIAIGQLINSVRCKSRYILWVLLIEYLLIVVCSTVIFRGVQSLKYTIELVPFWTYKAVVEHIPGVSVWDIILNVVLFLPLGFLVKLLNPSLSLGKMLLIAVGCSLFIETSQYVFEKGIAQIDDVMHNAIGAMIGWGAAKGTLALPKRIRPEWSTSRYGRKDNDSNGNC